MSRTPSLIIFCLLMSVAAYLVWQQQSEIYQDKGRLIVTEQDGAVILSWHTSVEVPMEARFREAFDEWDAKTDTFIIDLHSGGGALREGSRVIEAIREMKRDNLVITVVAPGNSCLSMCVPIYLQGEKRVASATSNWMFHEPKAYDYFDGEESNQPKFERDYKNNRFFKTYFEDSVITKEWQENLKQEWVGKDVWRTGKQLVDERSNIITDLKP